MARVTLEDKWWTDPRRSALSEEIKSELLADGVAVKLFRVAQDYWKNGSGGIPFTTFALIPHSQSLIRSGLVSVRDRLGSACVSFNLASFSFEFRSGISADEMFVFVRGSAEYLDWLRVHKENSSEAGKKSAQSRLKSDGSAQPKAKKRRSNVEPKQTNAEPAGSNLEPSVSFSSSFSSSFSDSDSANFCKTEISEGKTLGSRIWESYRDAFELRYPNVELARGKTENSQCKSLGEKLGEDAIEVVKFYLKHNDGFYLKALHSIGLCLRDYHALHVQWQRGHAITGVQVRQFEKQSVNMDLLAKVREGKA